jgi:hypothetical protein
MARVRNLFVLFAMVTSLGATEVTEKQFTLIAENVVLANEAMSCELKSLTWKTADEVWAPTQADALSVVARLKSDQGTNEILSCGGRDTNMDACLKRISLSRFQAFGLIIKGRKQILLDASPVYPNQERYQPNMWLTEIVSVRVLGGGAGYWWTLYDCEAGRFVECNRRP